MRNIPILRLGFFVSIATSITWAVFQLVTVWYAHTRLVLVLQGEWHATDAVLLIGCLELAGRLHGRAAIGAKLAAAGYATLVAVGVAREVFPAAWLESHSLTTAIGWIQQGIALAIVAGFIVTAWARRRAAIVAGVVAIAAMVAPLLIPLAIYGETSETTWQRMEAAFAVAGALHAGALMWLAVLARPADPVPATRLAARGLRWMSNATWGRVFAAFALLFVAMAATSAGAGSEEMARVATVGQVVVELVLLAAFGVGAFALARAALDGAARTPFVLAGYATFWCAGVMIAKLPHVWRIARGGDDFGIGGDYYEVLSLAEPIVALAAVAVAAVALRGVPALARHAELAHLASSRAVAFVVLMLASVGLASGGAASATSVGGVIGAILLAAVTSLVAMALVASLFGRAAETLERDESNLPTATVV